MHRRSIGSKSYIRYELEQIGLSKLHLQKTATKKKKKRKIKEMKDRRSQVHTSARDRSSTPVQLHKILTRKRNLSYDYSLK